MQQLPAAVKNQGWQQQRQQQQQHLLHKQQLQQQWFSPTLAPCAIVGQRLLRSSKSSSPGVAAAMAVLLPAPCQQPRRGEAQRLAAAETTTTTTTTVVDVDEAKQQQQQQQQQLRGEFSEEQAGTGHSKPIAFVFDIDGVLVQGPRVLPAAQRALRSLYSECGTRALHPVAFLTNGGGQTEADKAAQLSGQLGVTVEERQVVMAHTPFRDLLPAYGHLPVLAVGRGALTVARHYGFERAVTSRQLARIYPAAVPFVPQPPQGSADEPGEGSAAWPIADAAAGTAAAPLAAVLVFNDPEDWYLDLQLCCDVLTSGGVLDGSNNSSSDGGMPPPSIPIYFSNADLLFANNFPAPRFGQGAFGVALEALYSALVRQQQQQQEQPSSDAGSGTQAQAQGQASGQAPGAIPNRTTYGKPNPEPYALVQRLLAEQAADLGIIAGEASPSSSSSSGDSHASSANAADAATQAGCAASSRALPAASSRFSAIYMVGDNPPADVRGANRAGPPWVSVLVRTGVFKGGPGENCPVDPAHVVADDVEEAVAAALAARVVAE